VVATDTIDPQVIDLVERAQAGDGAAFSGIYDLYVDRVFGYVYRRVQDRPTAEDLTSDVFFRAYRRLGKFTWQGVDIGAWLLTIARNRVNDHFKSARFRLESTTDEISEPDITPDRPDSPERIAVARDMARSLASALDQLSDDHREVIELRFVHGLNVAETAEVMHRTPGAVKALQYRASRALADVIRDEPSLSDLAALGLGTVLLLLRTLGRP
jgi:RNA polymerase sigma-70 factor (ECF subfamily)